MVLQKSQRYTDNMRLVQIYTAVDAIARLGSIRRAAEILAISPSALNRQILGLEAELGLPLFDRLTNGVRLSTAGEIYIKAFRDHLNDLKRVGSQIADLSGQRIGTVRIGVGPELSTVFLPRLIGNYQREHPHVNFRLETMSYDVIAEDVAQGELDVAVAVEPVLVPGMSSVASEDVALVGVSRGPEPRCDAPLSFGDLAQRPLIVPTRASGLRNVIDAMFAGRRITPHYLVEVDSAVTPILMHDPDVLWLAVAQNIEPQLLGPLGLCTHAIAPGTIPSASVQIVQREHRVLPVAVTSIMTTLAMELAGETHP